MPKLVSTRWKATAQQFPDFVAPARRFVLAPPRAILMRFPARLLDWLEFLPPVTITVPALVKLKVTVKVKVTKWASMKVILTRRRLEMLGGLRADHPKDLRTCLCSDRLARAFGFLVRLDADSAVVFRVALAT
jgi:hypothetical protein